MEDLPADEKILYIGGFFSTESSSPDIGDMNYMVDYSDYDIVQSWDWSEPLYWTCAQLCRPMPDKTYYMRGYVLTDKGEYYSNTVEIRPSVTAPVKDNPDAYEIPVIFHFFPDDAGNYIVREWLVGEQIDFANHVYSNAFNIPGQFDTGVRFVLATHAPDGTPLSAPGIVYETSPLHLGENGVMDGKYIWDMEQVLNVWVMPFDDTNPIGGYSFSPMFDEDKLLEGGNIYRPQVYTGIFMNATYFAQSSASCTFAHEAGHFLGLEHVFIQDYCDDTRYYDRDAYLADDNGESNGFYRVDGNTGEIYLSDNVMDYDYSFMTGFTAEQIGRIQYTLQYAYCIPGEAGYEETVELSSVNTRRAGGNPVR